MHGVIFSYISLDQMENIELLYNWIIGMKDMIS